MIKSVKVTTVNVSFSSCCEIGSRVVLSLNCGGSSSTQPLHQRPKRTKFVYTKKLNYAVTKIDYYIELIVMSHEELR